MITCNNCKSEFDSTEDLQLHFRQARQSEAQLGRSDPRFRVILALRGEDHEQIMPDVCRRAFLDKWVG